MKHAKLSETNCPEGYEYPYLRGLNLRVTPCGFLTASKHRQRHNWITIDWDTKVRKEWGEDYDGATKHGLTTKAYLILELK